MVANFLIGLAVVIVGAFLGGVIECVILAAFDGDDRK